MLKRMMHQSRFCHSAFVNGRSYQLPQRGQAVVGICIDGNDPTYFEAARDVMPNLQRMQQGLCDVVIPTFTNPNNVSIATGAFPEVHGICGNFYLEPSGREVMMNDPSLLRAETIFKHLSQDAQVFVITAKKKLLGHLTHGFAEGSCGFAAETADLPETAELLRAIAVGPPSEWMPPAPGIYDVDCSLWLIEAGLKLLELKHTENTRTVAFLSTTDYLQHKFAPNSTEAINWYRKLDEIIGRLDAAGHIVGIVADHGMSDLQAPDGPNVVYLQQHLHEAGFDARVILPITDPYVKHHGALGGFATVYCADAAAQAFLEQLLPGGLVLTRQEAAKKFRLPADRIGDLVVCAPHGVALGKIPAEHDMSQLGGKLRSHGSLFEQRVPFVVNRPLKAAYSQRLAAGELMNFDLYDVLLNGLDQ